MRPVVVAGVIEEQVNSGQRVVGSVTPMRRSTVGSAVDGRVEAFLVNQGDRVAAGQVLAQLRTDTLEIERAAAQAQLELSQQRLAELRNGSRPEEIAEAEANMLGAKAAADNALSRLQRIESLTSTRAVSATDLENAREQAKATKFTFMATKALYERIKEGPRLEAIAQAEAQVELQSQRLNLIQDQIEKFTITAPFDGFVAAEFTEVGAWISRGDPIAQVIQMDVVKIQAPVTAEHAVSLRIGDAVRVEFPELPNQLLTGIVDRIVPIAESRSRTFPVFVNIKNTIRQGTPMLMAGMLARVELPSGQRQTLPLVPKDSLVLNGNDRAVYVVDLTGRDTGPADGQTGTVRKVNVDLGVAWHDRIQVHGDVRLGDLVVVVGNERLVPNSKVRIIRRMDTADIVTPQ